MCGRLHPSGARRASRRPFSIAIRVRGSLFCDATFPPCQPGPLRHPRLGRPSSLVRESEIVIPLLRLNKTLARRPRLSTPARLPGLAFV